jgi:hypothetical protein
MVFVVVLIQNHENVSLLVFQSLISVVNCNASYSLADRRESMPLVMIFIWYVLFAPGQALFKYLRWTNSFILNEQFLDQTTEAPNYWELGCLFYSSPWRWHTYPHPQVSECLKWIYLKALF